MNEQENEQQVNGQEEVKRDFKDIAGDAFEQGRKLIGRTASSGVVQKTIAKIKEEFANGKAWCSVNWANGGYGKFRVIVVIVVLVLAFKGLFFGGDAGSKEVELAKIQKDREETAAAAAFLGAMFSGGDGNSSSSSSSSSSQGPTMHTWTCRKCGRQLQSKWPPSSQIQCRAWSGRNDGTKNCQFSRAD